MSLGAFVLTGLPTVLWYTPALEQEREMWVLGAYVLSLKCWMCGPEKNPTVPRQKEKKSIKKTVNVWGNKEDWAQTENEYSLGCLWTASILKSLAFSFSQDSRHGGILNDLGKQGEVLGNQVLKDLPGKGQSWHSFPLQCAGVKPELLRLAVWEKPSWWGEAAMR